MNTLIMTGKSLPSDWSGNIDELHRCLNDGWEPELFNEGLSHNAKQRRQTLMEFALKILLDGDFHQRWEMERLLPKFGHEVISPLVSILANPEHGIELRWFAGRILGRFNHPEAILALSKLLEHDTDESLSTMAATSLAQIGPTAVEVLAQQLMNSQHRELIVRALAQVRCQEVVVPLLKMVDDPNPTIRAMVIETLSVFHDARIIPILWRALKDSDAIVRKEGAIALRLFFANLPASELVTNLTPLLHDQDFEVCRQTAITLGKLQTIAATTELHNVLRGNSSWALKQEIIQILAWIETSQSLQILGEMLTSEDHLHRDAIIMSIGRTRSSTLRQQATLILITFIQAHTDITLPPQIRQALAWALGELQKPVAYDVLTLLATDPDRRVQLHALSALKKIPAPSHG